MNILLPALIVALISCSGEKTTPVPPNVIMIVADEPGTRQIMDDMAGHIHTRWAPSVGGRFEVNRAYRSDAFNSRE